LIRDSLKHILVLTGLGGIITLGSLSLLKIVSNIFNFYFDMIFAIPVLIIIAIGSILLATYVLEIEVNQIQSQGNVEYEN